MLRVENAHFAPIVLVMSKWKGAGESLVYVRSQISCVIWVYLYAEHPIVILHCKYFIYCHPISVSTESLSFSFQLTFHGMLYLKLRASLVYFTCKILYSYLLPSNCSVFQFVLRIPFLSQKACMYIFVKRSTIHSSQSKKAKFIQSGNQQL